MMINLQPQLGIFFLIGLILLILAGSGFIFLLRLKQKSPAGQMMLRFFLFISLSGLVTMLTNFDQPWSWAFAPAQDAMLILGGVFLARFAYFFPEREGTPESQRVGVFFMGLGLLAGGYSLYFGWDYLRNLPADINELQSYYFLTPFTILGLALVMFRRSVVLTREAKNTTRGASGANTYLLDALRSPGNPAAYGFRNMGLALLVALLPFIVFLIKRIIPNLLFSFIFNLGVILSISLIIIVYLNMAVEYRTVMAKLIGISLVAVLLLLGGLCITILHFFPFGNSHQIVVVFSAAVLISSGFILGIFPIFFRGIIQQPLQRLLTGVQAANEGDLDVAVDVKFHDELGYLTESFNGMIKSLRELSSELQDKAARLETANVQKTEQLLQANRQLQEENQRRKQIQERLNQQLSLEHALADCSRFLLQNPETQDQRRDLLDSALSVLSRGADASRAYIFEVTPPDKGPRNIRMIAEACAPGVPDQINHEVNQNYPLNDLPKNIIQSLNSGQAIQGPTAELFSDHPLKNAFLSHDPPLLSAALFPIFISGTLWGFIGFDDCFQPRQWNRSTINYLGLASELVGSTIQRWDIEDQLALSMTNLEDRVERRTRKLNRSNEELQAEINRRKGLQNKLEQRLSREQILNKASAKLAGAGEFHTAVNSILKDLGAILKAGSISLIINRPGDPAYQTDKYQWSLPEKTPLDRSLIDVLLDVEGWVYSRIKTGEPLVIGDIALFPDNADLIKDAAQDLGIESFIIWPLISGDIILGLLLICNSALDSQSREESLQSLDMFTNLLSGVLERELIVQNLEKRVTEQTREISTLYEMTLQSDEAQDLAETIFPALSRIQEISSSEIACVHIYEQESMSLKLLAQQGLPGDLIPRLEVIPVKDYQMQDWLEYPDPDFGYLRNFQEDAPEQLSIPGYGTYLICRIRALGSTLGVISCYRKIESEFSSFQISVMAIVGELLGVVLKNHSLTRETRDIATIQERQRLARDLHDAVSQSLYSLSLFARSARDARDTGDDQKLTDALLHLEENSLSALREMRLLLYQLRSIALDEGSLREAIDSRISLVERRLGIDTEIDIDDQIDLNTELEQDLFQVITEGLNNSLRHANASAVEVKLKYEGKNLVLSITDNGAGFDLNTINPGLGLENIRQRIDIYDGDLTIDSQTGKGTRLSIRVPF